MPPKTATTKAKSEAKPKVKTPAPDVERYDWDRTIGPDPRDPRTLGPPCHGEHVAEPMGRGSKSGANRHARWESCAACGLRISYTPTWGSHGMTRQPGAIPQDVRQQLEEKKPEKYSVELTDKKIALDAQERSLATKMQLVQKQKEEWLKIQADKDAKTKVLKEPKNDQKWIEAENKFLDAPFCPAMTPEEFVNYQKQQEEEMNQAPGRKYRKAEESAENLEYAQRTAEQEEWTHVTEEPQEK